jgi:tRNA (guanine-N7-)-methyltransferase
VIAAVVVATAAGERRLVELGAPLPLARLLPGGGEWEVEIGFGKGRFLLGRAAAEPGRRYLGIEVAGEYFRLAARRLRRRGLDNVALVHGEALFVLDAILPRAFASVVHAYFPDPWPKSRHQRRRLFSPASVDLVLGLLAPGGTLCFATDFLDYGEEVASLLAAHPALAVERRDTPWPEGPRTNYEAKYAAEGRPILRLVARLAGTPAPSAAALRDLTAACAPAAADPALAGG